MSLCLKDGVVEDRRFLKKKIDILIFAKMAFCYTQMGCYLSKYERERDAKMIISRSATIKIRKNKKKVTPDQ